MGVDGTPGSGRALRLDPYALPVRYAARDGGADGHIRQIELDRERVVLRREVRGIRMKVGVPVNEFRGVAMRTLPPEGEEPAAVAVMLEHRDNGLTVPLFVAADGDDAMAEWKCWGRVLGVPLLVVEGDGALREPFRRIGRVAVRAACAAPPAPRRDQLAPAVDPDAAQARPARRRAARASRRARDHRAQLAQNARFTVASSTSAANRISPASRLERNMRRQESGSSISMRAICQARCAAKAASPSANTKPASAV